MADKAQLLREMRERNYNAAKGIATAQAKPVKMDELKKIATETPQPEKKKRGPYKKKDKPAIIPEKKRRGPYKKKPKQ